MSAFVAERPDEPERFVMALERELERWLALSDDSVPRDRERKLYRLVHFEVMSSVLSFSADCFAISRSEKVFVGFDGGGMSANFKSTTQETRAHAGLPDSSVDQSKFIFMLRVRQRR